MLTMDRYNNMLPYDTLTALARDEAENYQNAQPCRHGVYDGIFDEKILDAILEEIESVENNWTSFETEYEKKFQFNRDQDLPPITRAFFHNLNSEPFLRFLSELTGIKGLIPDPYMKGGGIHKIPRGGKLGVHVDFNLHRELDAYRRINVIIYLNKNWKEEYGGHFQLWREAKSGCEKKVLPIFNRMAIFSTTNTSFHGHPEPLNCPEDRSRRSLALYYYTSKDPGEQSLKKHSTVFLDEDGRRDELGKRTFADKVKNKIGKVF
ncbi:2OG-Fe(II) oxygenase [Halioxenophilus sp. WMMB6]|uniref:2OG-Fe(II) oxygenase n=1 Tax=Halioxenophilus sp. WMMB6 TaxID=3073815 RepID=UPI00295EB6C8|nr:2OG-Fe(II) oxygenase [Halioxenophilus sp. WMMB6]